MEKRETLRLSEGGEGREEVGEILEVGSVPGTPPDTTAHQWVASASLSEHLQGNSWFYLGNFSTASLLQEPALEKRFSVWHAPLLLGKYP